MARGKARERVLSEPVKRVIEGDAATYAWAIKQSTMWRS